MSCEEHTSPVMCGNFLLSRLKKKKGLISERCRLQFPPLSLVWSCSSRKVFSGRSTGLFPEQLLVIEPRRNVTEVLKADCVEQIELIIVLF